MIVRKNKVASRRPSAIEIQCGQDRLQPVHHQSGFIAAAALLLAPTQAQIVTDLELLQAQIFLEFGEFLQRTGEPDEALRFCEEGLAIRRRLGSEGVAEAEAAVARAQAAMQRR